MICVYGRLLTLTLTRFCVVLCPDSHVHRTASHCLADAGQILVLTSPMVGNYGVPPDTRDEWDLPKFFESDKIHIAALIVCEHSGVFSHWNAAQSLSQWLQDNGESERVAWHGMAWHVC